MVKLRLPKPPRPTKLAAAGANPDRTVGAASRASYLMHVVERSPPVGGVLCAHGAKYWL
jgi:hypothetical protein